MFYEIDSASCSNEITKAITQLPLRKVFKGSICKKMRKND